MTCRDVLVGDMQWWRVITEQNGPTVTLSCFEPYAGHTQRVTRDGSQWGKIQTRPGPRGLTPTLERCAESAAFLAYEEALIPLNGQVARRNGDLVLTFSSPEEAAAWSK
jgi:hypothetical protein